MPGDGAAAVVGEKRASPATPRETRLFIAGEWREGAAGETFQAREM